MCHCATAQIIIALQFSLFSLHKHFFYFHFHLNGLEVIAHDSNRQMTSLYVFEAISLKSSLYESLKDSLEWNTCNICWQFRHPCELATLCAIHLFVIGLSFLVAPSFSDWHIMYSRFNHFGIKMEFLFVKIRSIANLQTLISILI